MNHLEYACKALEVWALWQRTHHSHRLSWPNSAPFIHAGEIRDTATVDKNNPEAERVEKAMLRLKKINHDVFKVLECEYIYQMTNRDGAKRCGCCERVYRDRRSSGELFIAGQITVLDLAPAFS